MFREKNISTLIVLTPVLTVFLSAFFTIYFFIKNQYAYFDEESTRIEKEYINKQKSILEKEIDYVINYIDYHVKENKNLSEEDLRNRILRFTETIRYEKFGYIWIHDTDFFLRAHPFRQESLNTYDVHLKDAAGTLITKKFIEETIKKPDGVFISYSWQKPNELHFSPKLGFFKLHEKFNWVIGAGLYMDDIENSILENKRELEERIDKYIQEVLTISIGVILLIGMLSFAISRNINLLLLRYKDNVKKKELLLQDLNKNLEKKIEKAIKEDKKKDRAMLHQSRLARMGTMLSMIAHQWRQPLSEISGILMEIETANKFRKLDDKMVNESVAESNRLIQFMSTTIDDFRNFFKPDKKKVHFSVEDACNEAISLAAAAIKSNNIDLKKEIKCNAIIYGYKREFAQVMLNLISNAKDILSQRDLKNPFIEIVVGVIDEKAVVTVTDNGGGIKEQFLELIFEPYFTTKDSSKGTGLGLYMSKMIIEKNMNGELSVENTEDGAKFRVELGIEDE